MKWRTYPAYRDSGVEWLGEIPEHWGVKRLKYLATVNDDVLPETTEPDFGISYVDISSVDAVNGITKKEEMTFENAPSRARRRVRDGDIIVSTVRTYLRAISPVVDPESNMIVSTGFAVVRPGRELNSHFAAYALRSPYFVDAVVARSVGVSYPAINATEMIELPVALTSVGEQQAVAAFLDRETSRIDDLIAKKQRQIELLQEKRSALISHVVTKGLDPDVKMRDSGVEWLGEIPEHWKIVPLKFLLKVVSKGTTPSTIGMDFVDSGIRFIKAENITAKGITDEPAVYIDELTNQALRRSILQINDVLMVIAGATTGKVAMMQQDHVPANTNQAVAFIRLLDSSMAQFLCYWLSGSCIQNLIKLNMVQSAQPNLSMEDIKNLIVPLPPKTEMRFIESYMDRASVECDIMITRVNRSIDLLREYRTALISAAVTGKIDVREEVA